MSIRSTQRILSMVLAAAALVSTGALTGCAGFWQPVNTSTTTNSGNGDFVYVGKNSSSTLAGYQIGTGGSLTPIASGLTIAAAPTSLAISPTINNSNFLYAGTTNGIYGYSISSTGTLSALNSGSALASFSVAALDVSPDGNWLVAIATSPFLNGNVAGYLYPLNSTTGLIGDGAALTAPVTGSGEAVQFAPTENEAGVTVSTIAASFGTAGVYTYTFGTSQITGGIPSLVSTLPVDLVPDASDNGLVWNSSATAIFFVSGGGDDTLFSYLVNTSTGVITAPEAGYISTGANPTALSFDSSGAYIYVTNSGTSPSPGSTISGYIVGTSGGTTTFSALSTSPYSTSGSDPGAIVDAGGYILAVNQTGPPDLLLYTVDTTTPGRLYVSSSENTTYIVNTGTAPGTGISIAVTE